MTRAEQSGSFFRKAQANLRGRVEFGDALIFFYALVFVRQYFWIVDNNLLGWALSVPLAAAGLYLYVTSKQFPAEKFGHSFWLLVGLPLLLAYLLRAAFPDHSYDVLNYHLLNAERTLRGTLFGPGDFFPTAFAFNPVADTLSGISRLFLGFRLGTVINLCALVWAAQVVDKILRPFISRSWPRSACVLLILLSETLLFEISTYMVDLLTLPLMLEATLLTLRFDEARNRRASFIHVALLLGASVAFKITNLAVTLPVLALCGYQLALGPRRSSPGELAKATLLGAAGFLVTLLPFSIYIFRVTGNPVFPVANVFFKSPYWPTHGGWDYRWGPQSFWETIVWPVMIWFKPERHSELALYSGRLSLGFLVAFIGLVFVWKNSRARMLCFVLIATAWLWSATNTGYSRYGLYQEVLAGITVVVVASVLSGRKSWSTFSWRQGLAFLFCLVLAIQSCFGIAYLLRKEWGSRPTVFAEPRRYGPEAKLMLRDRHLDQFLSDEQRTLFGGVAVWLETCPKSTGFEALINPNAPIIAVRQPEYFVSRESWRQFIRAVDASDTNRMYSLCLNDDVSQAKQVIAERGLEIGELSPVQLPFFSPWDRIGMMLIHVRRPEEPEALGKFETGWMKGAFPSTDYREEILAIDPPASLHPGEKVDIRFKVKNLGNSIWPAVGTKDFRYQINMGDRWIGFGTRLEDNRAAMAADLPPGHEAEMKLTVNAPLQPGDYTLEIDMVHEGVTWFSEKGARPLHLNVHVAP
jgi:hypothetical protein